MLQDGKTCPRWCFLNATVQALFCFPRLVDIVSLYARDKEMQAKLGESGNSREARGQKSTEVWYYPSLCRFHSRVFNGSRCDGA